MFEMKYGYFTKAALLVVGSALLTLPTAAHAQIVYNESVAGDLSNSATVPTLLEILETTTIIGSAGGDDTQDFFVITVPVGFLLSGYTNTLFNSPSGDGAGFTGFTSGTGFSGNLFNPGSYMGYAHFGVVVFNGELPETNLVGVNLLPLMSDPSIAQGATGFTNPLGAGTYTFLIQQRGESTEYRFALSMVLIPAPGSIALLGLGGLVVARRRRS